MRLPFGLHLFIVLHLDVPEALYLLRQGGDGHCEIQIAGIQFFQQLIDRLFKISYELAFQFPFRLIPEGVENRTTRPFPFARTCNRGAMSPPGNSRFVA